jgi:hypothetical protein
MTLRHFAVALGENRTMRRVSGRVECRALEFDDIVEESFFIGHVCKFQRAYERAQCQ